tara:strand:- start:2103 stop:2321 length:219 start_codon:yes stop_codon:yes gene_type:complete
MIWKDILKYTRRKLGCTTRVKLTPEMEKDINLVIRRIMGDVSMKDKVKQVLEMDVDEPFVSKPHNRDLEFVN